MRFRFKLLSMILSAFPALAVAGQATDSMTDCLVKLTTGQDRIDLIRWVMLAFSKHPDVATFVRTDPAIDAGIQMRTAAIFTRLVVEDCISEAKVALKSDGEAAFGAAFQILGQVAASELMRNPKVGASIDEFLEYLDEDKINNLFR